MTTFIPEIVSQIVAFLNHDSLQPKELLACSHISTTFYRVCQPLWRNLILKHFTQCIVKHNPQQYYSSVPIEQVVSDAVREFYQNTDDTTLRKIFKQVEKNILSKHVSSEHMCQPDNDNYYGHAFSEEPKPFGEYYNLRGYVINNNSYNNKPNADYNHLALNYLFNIHLDEVDASSRGNVENGGGQIYSRSKYFATFSFSGIKCNVSYEGCLDMIEGDPKVYDCSTIGVLFTDNNYNKIDVPDPLLLWPRASPAAREKRTQFWQGFSLSFLPFMYELYDHKILNGHEVFVKCWE
jgi:hypothetical protein